MFIFFYFQIKCKHFLFSCSDWLSFSVICLPGFHVFQRMYGCEWNDETGKVKGLEQFGYNGEDFLAFDLKTESWIAVKHQAFTTKQKWDHSKHIADYEKNYLSKVCLEWLKKYLRYQEKSLMKTGIFFYLLYLFFYLFFYQNCC